MKYIAKLRTLGGITLACLAIICSVCAAGASAEGSYFIRGIVRDSITNEPLPYASVVATGCSNSAVADAQGIFELSVPEATPSLMINCVGYGKKLLPLKRKSLNIYVVYLSPETMELGELVVKKNRYSKRNNPAVEFSKRLKEEGKRFDPYTKPFFSFDKYERISLGLNDFEGASEGRYSFLTEHVDTSEISGKPFLGLLVKEKRSMEYNRHSPKGTVEYIDGERQEGIDEIAGQEAMRVFLEDVMRPIELYDNDINLLHNRFVSPLSPLAPDFYRFYLADTVEVDGEKCAVLSFYPRNKASFGFNGHIYVPVGDSTLFVRHIEMSVPREINLNFVDNLLISQDFTKAPDGTRLKTSDALSMELSYMGKGLLYATRRTSYANHSFEVLADSIFTGASRIVASGASLRDSAYWKEARLVAIPQGESKVGSLMSRLREIPAFYWGEKALKILFTGYVGFSKNSKFEFGPVNSIISFNHIDRVRLRIGGMTTAALSRRFFASGYVARGFRDHRWKYGADLEYSFVNKKEHAREFPVRSVRVESQYDLYYPGEEYHYTSPDNIVLSLKRSADRIALYRRLNRISFTWETASQLSLSFSGTNQRVTPVAPLYFHTTSGTLIPAVTTNSFELEVRYAPGEKYFQTRTRRVPINLDAPSISLRQVYAPRWGRLTSFAVNKTEIEIARRWWLSAFGYIDMYLAGGHVWNSTDYLTLFTPDVNLSYTIQPRTFALLNPMEFVCSSFATWDITYWLNGALLNMVPLVKKLKLRETIGFRGYWGTISDDCKPGADNRLPVFPVEAGTSVPEHKPYMEMSAGLDNIFKVLRVEYVWRLNYTHTAARGSRRGVRVALHMTF